jgi:hypothetical protein
MNTRRRIPIVVETANEKKGGGGGNLFDPQNDFLNQPVLRNYFFDAYFVSLWRVLCLITVSNPWVNNVFIRRLLSSGLLRHRRFRGAYCKHLVTLDVGISASCRTVSTLLFASFGTLCRQLDDRRRDARRRFPASCMASRCSSSLYSEFCVGVWTVCVATLGVGLLALCRVASRGLY